MGYKGQIISKKQRIADVNCHIACNKKIKSLISFSFSSFESALNETIEWYVKVIKRM